MSTLEIKQALHELIDTGDDKFVKMFYEMAKVYAVQHRKDKMIAEGEADIKAGRIHSQQNIKDFISNWKA